MHCDNGQMEVSELFLHLLSSLRTADARIDELRTTVQNTGLSVETRKEIADRVERLLSMRMCLLYSLMDCRLAMIGYCDSSQKANESFDKNMFDSIIRSLRH